MPFLWCTPDYVMEVGPQLVTRLQITFAVIKATSTHVDPIQAHHLCKHQGHR